MRNMKRNKNMKTTQPKMNKPMKHSTITDLTADLSTANITTQTTVTTVLTTTILTTTILTTTIGDTEETRVDAAEAVFNKEAIITLHGRTRVATPDLGGRSIPRTDLVDPGSVESASHSITWKKSAPK